ncbi:MULTISPECIES: DUF6948 domain-containing protein [unclassified Paracoccus (in: a-proteobacteria)]|uniref:DUF6948 domain-containing protein n=1 Tax=unclassified Paracoccus (in: a-proteobacteria) TaxID=2688777 RepID=UPI0012B33B7D|nr:MULTISPECIES: hypothetical protein [unclassified Paracoccus (in: a-proteobacteria)]UXU73795.1 hypothetical protein GB879_007550 [Paracoccus sp. SMMA_5]UXU79685.1 hypothetical protein GB880_007540 [Paracoccus sp. SMMA_5_TC]
MNIDNLTIGEAKRIAAMFGGVQSAPETIGEIGRKVIVRSRDAGVIYGEYAGSDGSTVHVANGRQLWKWCAAKGISLIDVATYGVNASECKFSDAAATVTVFNACALIDVTATAAASIEAV